MWEESLDQFTVTDLRGPHMAQNFLNFMQFSGKFGKIVSWRSPGGSAPPPTGNPGSAPGLDPSY